MLISPYMPNSPKVVDAAGTIAAGAAFGGILSTQYFLNYCNCGNNYVIRRGI